MPAGSGGSTRGARRCTVVRRAEDGFVTLCRLLELTGQLLARELGPDVCKVEGPEPLTSHAGNHAFKPRAILDRNATGLPLADGRD